MAQASVPALVEPAGADAGGELVAAAGGRATADFPFVIAIGGAETAADAPLLRQGMRRDRHRTADAAGEIGAKRHRT